jgi:hypothetical protein
VQYHVELPGGREVVCQRQNEEDDPASGWRVGATVELGWEEASALVLEPEGVAQEEDLRLIEEDRG